jgi:hypothetical protein
MFLRIIIFCGKFVPANCTSELQPLDADGGVNGALKTALREKFTHWYAQKVADALNENMKPEKIDLRLSVVKPLHASWFLSAFDQIALENSVMATGWEKTGIASAIQNALSPEKVISVSID